MDYLWIMENKQTKGFQTMFTHPERKLTDKEFRAIPRNQDGDVLDESTFVSAWIFATDSQKKTLTGDDQTRGDNLDEEIRCLAAEFE